MAVENCLGWVLKVLELAVEGCQTILESARLARVGSWTVLLLIKTFYCTERVGLPDPPTSVQLKELARLKRSRLVCNFARNPNLYSSERVGSSDMSQLACTVSRKWRSVILRESTLLRWVSSPVLTSELNYFVPRTRACQSRLFHRRQLLQIVLERVETLHIGTQGFLMY